MAADINLTKEDVDRYFEDAINRVKALDQVLKAGRSLLDRGWTGQGNCLHCPLRKYYQALNTVLEKREEMQKGG